MIVVKSEKSHLGDNVVVEPARSCHEKGEVRRREALRLLAAGVLGCASAGFFTSASPAQAASRGSLERGELARLNVTSRWDLDFGKLASLGTGGYVTVDSETGTKLVTGSLVDLGGRHQRARLDIRGEPGEGFVIFLPTTLRLRGRRNTKKSGHHHRVSIFSRPRPAL